MNLADKLFVATISGSKQSRIYFAAFKSKFKPDGDFAEQYNELAAMLRVWDFR